MTARIRSHGGRVDAHPVRLLPPLIAFLVLSIVLAPPARAEFGYIGKWGGAGNGDGQFAQEADVATDSAGNVYALDHGNSRVQKFDADGRYLAKWGTLGSGPGQFHQARHLAADASGNVYVSDAGNSRVQVFSSSGELLKQWSSYAGTASIAVDEAGASVYIGASREIVRYDAAGNVVARWGSLGSGPAQFDNVSDVAVDRDGFVYVLDTGLARVQRFAADGSYVSEFSVAEDQGRNMPSLDVDDAGNVYVVDAFRAMLRRYAPTGELTYRSAGCASGLLISVAVGAQGSVYLGATGAIVRYGEGASGSCSGSSGTPAPSPGPPADSGELGDAPPPPAGRIGVSINDGARYTNDADVTLGVIWPEGARSALLANDGGFAAAHERPLGARMAWRLDSSGPERLPKTVYVRFGASSQTFTDDIVLDETEPRVLSAQIVGAGSQADAPHTAALRRYGLRVRANDKASGVSRLQVAVTKRRPSQGLPYRMRMVIRAVKAPRFVRVRDRAGNWSGWRRIR